MQPLAGIKVVDFSTLLPGPLASLILAEAGALVIKIERPGEGDELRSYEPRLGAAGAAFALLNRGKRSVAIDLKADGAKARLMPLLRWRRRPDRAVPARGHGTPGPRLRGARGDQPAPDLLLDHRLRPARAQGPGRRARPQLCRRDRAASSGGRPGRRPGGAAGPDRGHRRRQLPGGAQHPARAPRARCERARLPPRHRDDRSSVRADVVGARPGLRRGALAAPGRRAAHRRLAALSDLPDRRSPVSRRRAAGATLLGALCRADRARDTLSRRPARSSGDHAPRHARSSALTTLPIGRPGSPARTSAAASSPRWRRPCATPTSSRVACSQACWTEARADRSRRCRCRSPRCSGSRARRAIPCSARRTGCSTGDRAGARSRRAPVVAHPIPHLLCSTQTERPGPIAAVAASPATRTTTLTIDPSSIAYRLRRSARARRLRITVRPGGVEVVAPLRVREAEIRAFVEHHRAWIRTKTGALQRLLAEHPGSARLVDGARISYRGRPVGLRVVAARRRQGAGA